MNRTPFLVALKQDCILWLHGGRTERDDPGHGGDRRGDRGSQRVADTICPPASFVGGNRAHYNLLSGRLA